MNQRNSEFNTFVLGLIVGGILGTLYAPQKGEETRKMLKKLIEEWSEKGEDISEEVKQVFEEWKEKAEPVVEEIEEKIAPVAQKIKERTIEQITPIIEEVKEKAAPIIEEKKEETTPEAEENKPILETTLPELEPKSFPAPAKPSESQKPPQFFKGV
ncbi:hypothetical protein A2797_01680 [candidate division WWE3 bacterium RIFCSPHIGHO2_01_FULL_48_15]|uniref:YtxH domain-containing protein n=1 Tax=candidate division WWE3 bacterium RIFCSPHIGHO2_01_FULL_48_15 TaxID=1802619 RepID=A0A1F4VCB3_UNCKA|nr:MAG: hypothetical protein A2797_01680 [candidate division WWE3 bacterium RIFCSPHIGHO2_01_FULL_48_15]